MSTFKNRNLNPHRLQIGVQLALIFFIFVSPFACSRNNIMPPPPKADPIHGLSTPRIAVFPFQNRTEEAGIAHLVRVSFYSHLSARPFRDIELAVVDASVQNPTAQARNPSQIRELGRTVGADLVITGEIFDFHRVYVGVYSQMGVEAGIHVWDVATGRRIWSEQHRVDSHEGGLPFNPLEIPLIGVRSGYHLRDRNKIRIVDELSRHLAGRVPMPRSSSRIPAARPFELQVHAFSDRLRAANVIYDLRNQGYPAYLKSTTIRDATWHRVILGPYESRREAEEIRSRLPQNLASGAFVREGAP